MANVKNSIILLLMLGLAVPCYAQFSKNIIIYDDAVVVEGGGRQLDLREGLTATYDSVNGKYFLDVDGTGSATMLCPDGKSGNYCLIYESGVFRLYMESQLVSQWEKSTTKMDDFDGNVLQFIEGGDIDFIN